MVGWRVTAIALLVVLGAAFFGLVWALGGGASLADTSSAQLTCSANTPKIQPETVTAYEDLGKYKPAFDRAVDGVYVAVNESTSDYFEYHSTIRYEDELYVCTAG